MRAAILAVLTSAAAAAADPPELVRAVQLDRKGAPFVNCTDACFLADGKTVAVRWSTTTNAEDSTVRVTTVGPAGPSATAELGGCRFLDETTPGPRLVRSRAGDLYVLGQSPPTARPAKKDGPPEVRGISVDPEIRGRRLYPSMLWLGGPEERVYVLSSDAGFDFALSQLEGTPLRDVRGKLNPILTGDRRDDTLRCVALHPVAGWFVVGLGPQPGQKWALDCWQLAPAPVKKLVPLPCEPSSLAFTPDGRTLAVGLGDGTVALVDPAKAVVLGDAMSIRPAANRQPRVHAIAFHPDGRHLACGTLDGKDNLVVLDTRTARVVFRHDADSQGVSAVTFNADGTRLAAVGGSGRVTVWDTTALGSK